MVKKFLIYPVIILKTIFEMGIYLIPMFLLNNLFIKNTGNVYKYIIFLGLNYLFFRIFTYIYSNLLVLLVEEYKLKLTNSIISNIKKAKLNVYLENETKYISWLKNDVEKIAISKCRGFYEIFSKVLILTVSYIILFILSKVVLLVNVLGVLLIMLISQFKMEKYQEAEYKLSKLKEKYFSSLSNLFANLSIFYYANKGNNFTKRFYEINDDYEKEYTSNFRKMYNSYFLIAFLSSLLQSVSMGIVFVYVYLNKLMIGTLTTIPFIIGNTSNQLGVIIDLYMRYKAVNPILEKFSEIETYSNNLKDIEKIESIRFDNVSLEFNDKKVFSNFTYTFLSNKKYLIIGESGIGKSTLIKMILGEIVTYTGKIYINDIDIKEINKKSLFNNLEYVDAKNFVFNYTLYDNISLFSKNVDESNMKNILQSVNMEYENKEIDENSLSTGQKQRVNLARLLSTNKEFVLLDEALTNVDKENYEKILSNIFNKFKSIILISHNENNYLNFDEVIDFNKLKESGEI